MKGLLACPQLSAEGRNVHVTCRICDMKNNNFCPVGPEAEKYCRAQLTSKKLKGQKVYLTEDLTKRQSNLYYLARQAVKNKHALATWTTDGRVLVMKTENEKPRRIDTEIDLQSYQGTQPLLLNTSTSSSDASDSE